MNDDKNEQPNIDVDKDNSNGIEDPTEEQMEWFKKKMPHDPFQNNRTIKQNDDKSCNHDNSNSKTKEGEKRRKKVMAYKYSQRMKGKLYESILFLGKPMFLSYEGTPLFVSSIEEEFRIIRPPSEEEYPYLPYAFSSLGEINELIQKSKMETVDSLFEKTKSFVRRYNDQDDYKIVLLAVDILWSYFQDKFSTTHYIGVIGENGSGKSTFGDTFETTAYRAVNMTDPNAANLFRILDRIESGQCTFVIDEADKIDRSNEIMNILKTGYQIKGKVPRTNMNTGEQEFFYTYCFKIFISEKSPDIMKAKGIHDRSFIINTYTGIPKNDIKEVQTPGGIKDRQNLLDELNELRKLLFIYRLIHFDDSLQEISIGLQGRDKELCKPYLQLFYKSKSYQEVQNTFIHFLKERKGRKSNLFEVALYPIIENVVSVKGDEVYVSFLWYAIKATIPGKEDEKRPDIYYSEDYGIIYRNKITGLVCDKFGAEKKHKKDGNILIFNKEKLVKIGRQYSFNQRLGMTIPEFNCDDEDGEGNEYSRLNQLRDYKEN